MAIADPPAGLRVAMITPYPAPDQALGSGVEWYSRLLAGALGPEGVEVQVVAQRPSPGNPQDGRAGGQDRPGSTGSEPAAGVTRAWRPGATALPAAARAALALQPDVVHIQHETFLYGGPQSAASLPVALGMLRAAGLRPVVTMHQVVDPATVDSDFVRMHRVRVPPRAARAALGAVREVCRRMAVPVVHEAAFTHHVPGARHIHHGIEPAGSPSGPTGREAKARLGLDPDRFTVLCFGFVAPYKGLEAALEAARRAGPAVQLVVAGGPHPRLAGRDSYAADLERRWGAEARFTGFLPDEEVPAWFGAADLVLIPYPRPFSSSGALSVALSLDRPVLLSEAMARAAGVPGEMGVDPDPATLSTRLLDLAGDDARLDALAVASRRLAAERSWTNVARRHVELYEEVAVGGRPARWSRRSA